jgi:hypothetical protein
MKAHNSDDPLRVWTHGILVSALFLSVSVLPTNKAHADSDLASAFESGASFESMNDDDMSQARGGYRGVSFGVYFNGSVSSQGNTGELPAGMSVTQDGDNRVQLQAALGDLGGANGLFQFTNVVGDMNVVNNSIVINVVIVPDLPSDVAAAWR